MSNALCSWITTCQLAPAQRVISSRGKGTADGNRGRKKNKSWKYCFLYLFRTSVIMAKPSSASLREIEIRDGDCHVDEKELPESTWRTCYCPWVTPAGDLRPHIFGTNRITSTKYTPATFLPVNFYEQIMPWYKPANFYFLCIAVLQSISAISTTQGKPTILMPLLFVVGVTMIKDWIEDSKRRQQDRDANEAMYKVWRRGAWVDVQAQNILVGDFVLIKEDGRLPCDVFVVGSGIDSGDVAFIDTKDLDGETNLKPKSVPKFLLQQFPRTKSSPDHVSTVSMHLQCDSPENSSFTDMGEWSGMIKFENPRRELLEMKGKQKKGGFHVGIDNFILRTCVLRNTPWIIGLAVYTGEQTKIRKNNAKNQDSMKIKNSTVFRHMNYGFAAMGLLQICCCLFASIFAGMYQSRLKGSSGGWGDAWYLALEDSPFFAGFKRFFTWFIICKDFLPISLYVSLEMVQFCQAKARVKNKDVAEELRKFKEDVKGAKVHPFVEFDERQRMLSEAKEDPKQAKLIQEYLYALSLNNTVFPKVKKPSSKRKKKMAGDEKQEDIKHDLTDAYRNVPLQLDSSSPDEKALVYFAQYMGYEVYHRAEGTVALKRTSGDQQKKWFEEFEDVCLIDFTSKRKRMTVIVSPKFGPEKGLLKIYCKGADSYVKALCRGAKVGAAEIEKLQKYNKTIFENLEEFGGESLRATAIEDKLQDGVRRKEAKAVPEAIKSLLDASIKIWVLTGDNVATAINIGISCNLLEADMTKEGRLFVFDDFDKKHKDLTPAETDSSEYKNAVRDLLESNGAYYERERLKAEEKARSEERTEAESHICSRCIVVGEEMRLKEETENQVKRAFIMRKKACVLDRQFDEALSKVPALRNKYQGQPLGLAMHGNVWKVVAHYKTQRATNEVLTSSMPSLQDGKSGGGVTEEVDMSIEGKFYRLAKECKSVLGCRLEPKEKAEIVKLMQRRENVPTLAIGDGNNDTVMIKTAEIGVGIRGVEGTSAVSASDYVISQFRFLTRLLLVHGRLNNRRICLLMYYIFYKTSLVVWTVLFFGFYSAFSGQFPYLDWMYQLHNIAFTALPIIIYAIFDRDIDPHTLAANPYVYPWSRGPILYGPHKLIEWAFWAFLHAVICFFIPWYAFEVTSPEKSGQSFGFQSTMLVVYCCVVIVTNQKLAFYAAHWNWAWHLVFWGSISVLFVAILVFSTSTIFAIGGIDYYFVGYRLFAMERFWMTLVLSSGLACMVDYTRAVMEHFFPDRTRVFVEARHLGKPVFDPDHVNLDDIKNYSLKDSKTPPGLNRRYTGSNFSFTPNVREAYQKKNNGIQN
eukprot:jgi/Bigna1/87603/estExt_fgenesh1_pg.C_220081